MSPPRRGRSDRRRPAELAGRRRIQVFAEGEKTEAHYVAYWHRLNRDRVVVTVDPFHGSPRRLVEEAAKTRRQDRRQGRMADEYWCVFDIDEHHKVDQAIDMAQANEIRLAISNPCIELWFILHFEDQTAHIDGSHAQRRSEAFLHCRKNLSSEALVQLEERFEQAKERARKLDRKHELDGSPRRENPSSNIWELVDRIRAE